MYIIISLQNKTIQIKYIVYYFKRKTYSNGFIKLLVFCNLSFCFVSISSIPEIQTSDSLQAKLNYGKLRYKHDKEFFSVLLIYVYMY